MLSSACRSEEFACKPGYKRFSDGSTRCYPTGCQEGALQASSSWGSIQLHSIWIVSMSASMLFFLDWLIAAKEAVQ